MKRILLLAAAVLLTLHGSLAADALGPAPGLRQPGENANLEGMAAIDGEADDNFEVRQGGDQRALYQDKNLVPSRIKDIAILQSSRDNQLIGYGLVIGLQGTGDGLRNSPFTEQSIRAMLENLGIASEGGRARSKNVAAVIVTANLPPFETTAPASTSRSPPSATRPRSRAAPSS